MHGRNNFHAHAIMRAKLMDGGAQTLTIRLILVRLIVCGRGQETRHASMVSGAALHIHANALTVIRVTLIRATHRITVEHATIVGGNIPIRGSRHVNTGSGRNIRMRHAGAHILSIHVHYDTTRASGRQAAQVSPTQCGRLWQSHRKYDTIGTYAQPRR